MPHLVKTLFRAALGVCVATGVFAESESVRKFDDLVWEERAPVIAIAPVWQDQDKGIFGAYVRIKAGATVPHHTHSFTYHGVVMQGNWRHYYGEGLEDAHSMTFGDYGIQPGEEVHTDGCAGPEDCVFYVVFMGPPDLLPHPAQ